MYHRHKHNAQGSVNLSHTIHRDTSEYVVYFQLTCNISVTAAVQVKHQTLESSKVKYQSVVDDWMWPSIGCERVNDIAMATNKAWQKLVLPAESGCVYVSALKRF